tara:strand:- start:53 stop:244 length:192 start_codon:yes stop_codon:yes gene_type:complete
MKIENVAGYFGAILMVVFSFSLQPAIAIVGLLLLTIQAIKIRAHNLILLNLISVGGFSSQLFF